MILDYIEIKDGKERRIIIKNVTLYPRFTVNAAIDIIREKVKRIKQEQLK
jgi:hypothetical protein